MLQLFYLFIKIKILTDYGLFLFIWLHWVLVAAYGIVNPCCSTEEILVVARGIEPGPPAFWAWSLSRWATREVCLAFLKKIIKLSRHAEALAPNIHTPGAPRQSIHSVPLPESTSLTNLGFIFQTSALDIVKLQVNRVVHLRLWVCHNVLQMCSCWSTSASWSIYTANHDSVDWMDRSFFTNSPDDWLCKPCYMLYHSCVGNMNFFGINTKDRIAEL